MLRIHGKLDIIADADLGHARHGAGIRIGQRYLVPAGAVQFLQHSLVAGAFIPDRRDLLRELAAGTAAAAANTLLLGIAVIEALHVVGKLLVSLAEKLRQCSAGEVAVLVVHRLDTRAIDRQQLPPEQVELAAQDDELAEHLPEGRTVDPPKGGYGAEVRLQAPEQPDRLDVAMRLRLQTTAGAYPVQISVDIELQHVGRIKAGASRLFRRHPLKAGGSQIEAINESLDETDRIVRAHIVVNRFR